MAADLLDASGVSNVDGPTTLVGIPARIGRYDILSLLGQGGMGRVYRAKDSQLERTVAVKVLPEAFTADEDYLRRFEQEARATAALNHPGIVAVYDVGLHEGRPYLVSELLEGTTLRARMDARRLTLDEVLDFSTQIAEALAAAHATGVVHRDLKPDNLFVCPGDRIKILDFGLAKLTGSGGSAPPIDVTGTLPNTILGTPAYMAPEQARAEPADHRADLFSFGCIVYEMLEGARPFEGKTAADLIGSILKDPPQALTSSIERPIPTGLDRIVQRCLAKDLKARFQSASDLAFALRSLSDRGTQAETTHVASGSRWPRRKQVAAAGVVLAGLAAIVAGAIGLAGGLRGSSANGRIAEFLIPPPTDADSFASMPLPGLLPTSPQAGLSPDGRLLAVVAVDPAGKRHLWIRSLEISRPLLVDKTEGATSWPFWSPDSRHVVIAIGRGLFKVDTVNNTVERFCTLPDEAPPVPFVTGSWGEDGTVLFSIGGNTGLYRIAASGGTPRALTRLDTARGDHYHSWPQLLPAGRFLFFVRTDNPETNGVYAGRLDSGEVTQIQANTSRALYANGHLLSTIEDRLVAQPFDTRGMRLTGQPETIVPSVFQGAGRTPGFWASSTDAIVYAVGDTRERQFRPFTRSGQALDPVGPPGLYVTFDASPDLGKVVVEVSKDLSARFSTLTLFEPARAVLMPLTLGDQNDSDPRFGPDGDLIFARNSRAGAGIIRATPGSGRQATVFPRGTLPVIWLEDWTDDGSAIVYRSAANRDAWLLAEGSAESQRLTDAREPIEQVQLSPDRRWIAYNTAESGRSEVYVSSVPFGRERRQVSRDGGVQATWRADGRELYYLGLDGGLYSVDISPGAGTLQAGSPALIFRTQLPVISAVVEQYRPSGDGQRFLFCLPLTSVRREPLRMLLNWPARLARGS